MGTDPEKAKGKRELAATRASSQVVSNGIVLQPLRVRGQAVIAKFSTAVADSASSG
jgi:hypothetical protein